MDTMKKILLIDDDKAIRLVLSAILKKNNYLPIEVPDGYKAIELFKKELPAAVLLDIKMPEMDGIQILQELKKLILMFRLLSLPDMLIYLPPFQR